MTARADAAGAGIYLARDMILAIASGDEPKVAELVNAAPAEVVRWAAATLTRCVHESVLVQVGGDVRRVGLALESAARTLETDALFEQVAAIGRDLNF